MTIFKRSPQAVHTVILDLKHKINKIIILSGCAAIVMHAVNAPMSMAVEKGIVGEKQALALTLALTLAVALAVALTLALTLALAVALAQRQELQAALLTAVCTTPKVPPDNHQLIEHKLANEAKRR